MSTAIYRGDQIFLKVQLGLALTLPRSAGFPTSNFNGTPIPGNSFIWFNSSLTSGGRLTSSGTISVNSFLITFTANGTKFSCENTPPVDDVTFDPSATIDRLIYFTSNNSWTNTLPLNLSGDTFLAPCIFSVPSSGLPGGITPSRGR
jgi:hypothetical protein